MINVTHVEALNNHRLHLAFSDGTSGEVDLTTMVAEFPPLAPLRDESLFAQAHLDGGTVAWPNGLDVAAERLYALVHDLPSPDTHERARANELEMSLRAREAR